MAIVRERPHDGVEVLRLDRPDRRNALDIATLAEVEEALAQLAGDDGLGALVLSTTTTTAFCAGADVAEHLDAEGGVRRMEAFARVYAALDAFPAPVVCVCVGDVVGAGTELAMGSDLRIAGENLRMRWVGARLGVPVGVARLVPLVGLARAKELIYLSPTLDGAAALAAGVVSEVVDADAAELRAIEVARELAERPGARLHKRLFREFEGTEQRVARENEILVEFQRTGNGLPQGGSPTR